MKGRIFIAWSGHNTLALKIKQAIETEDYKCVVGGESGSANGLFVGQAVLDQINRCNQAIFVVQKKDDGTISNNLMFEFGYALAKFNSNKIHVFYIDIQENDDKIPSDVKGIWADHYKTAEHENIADVIAQKFLSDQKYIIPEDKMAVVDSYYRMKELFKQYAEAPYCSEYELAQYVLFFSQAAYQFSDMREGKECLRELFSSLKNPTDELENAISFGIRYLETLENIQKSGDLLYLSEDDFFDTKNELLSIEENVNNWGEDDFTVWFRMLLYDLLNYAQVLFASMLDFDPEWRDQLLDECNRYAGQCLELCDELLKNPANRHFAELYKAYMYRNLATAYKMQSRDVQLVFEALDNSRKMREGLWNHYSKAKLINTKLFETFEMEYHLTLSELLEYMGNDMTRKRLSLTKCRKYLQRIKALDQEKSHFIRTIEVNIDTVDRQKENK